ncbi:kinase-like domain-containing protein [Haematococcus lacustris]
MSRGFKSTLGTTHEHGSTSGGSDSSRIAELEAQLARMKMREDQASLARARDIKTMLIKSFQLDLVFLIDVTGSMEPSISMVRDKVNSIVRGIKGMHPRTVMRLAFVGYRDYHDEEPLVISPFFEGHDAASHLSSFAAGVQAQTLDPYGDYAEDVFSGLEAVCGLAWNSQGSRILVHIADAPCHGREFHNLDSAEEGLDNYIDGDLHNRSIEAILHKLQHELRLQVYYFAHLTQDTKIMLQRFVAASSPGTGGVPWIQEEHLDNIQHLPEKLIIMASQSISLSLQKGMSGLGTNGGSSVVELKVVPKKPNWDTLPVIQARSWISQLQNAQDVVDCIQAKEPISFKKARSLEIKIARRPFSADGACRWPFWAQLQTPAGSTGSITDFVVKRFKVPLGKPPNEVHRKAKYASQMETQAVCACLQGEFNDRVADTKCKAKELRFSMVSLLEVPVKVGASNYYNMEKALEGQFMKYSNNAGYVNTKEYQATLQAFSHWTYNFSGGVFMVTDLQGVWNADTGIFWLCDPAVHCPSDILRFGNTNLGLEGCKCFFETHKCNHICAALGIKRPKF